jgi:hypothetical protein
VLEGLALVKANRKIFTLLLVAVAAGTAILSFCGSNSYHKTLAAGVVSMQDCMECHSGAVGKAVSICLGNECLYSNNHSLMHPYPPINKAADYAPLGDIEKAGCVLENGKITCLSCHDLTKPPPHLIREGDKLCSICHLYYATGRPR